MISSSFFLFFIYNEIIAKIYLFLNLIWFFPNIFNYLKYYKIPLYILGEKKMKLNTILTIIVSIIILASVVVILTTDFENISDVNKEDINEEEKKSSDGSHISFGNTTSFDEAVNDFSFDFFRKLYEDSNNSGNIFYSPYSVFTALAMTYEGARGDTADEMERVLKIDQDNESFHKYMKNLYEYLNENSNYNISTANALWVSQNFDLLEEYINVIRTYYYGESSEVDYSYPEKAASIINQWVENKTNNLIKNLVPSDAIDPDLTKLILTNAIYFKGTWQIQFDEENTTERDFITNDDDIIQVETMKLTNTKDRFNYTETEELQILELPYNGNEISMIILLPKDGIELSDVVNSMNKNVLSGWINSMNDTELDIYLPKFKFETKYNLNEYLRGLGMEKAFTYEADFSGINGEPTLCISSVLHKAYIEVNEEGTEAAAATAIVMILTSTDSDGNSRIVFNVDHPFLFLIQHKDTGTILFMGKVTNPLG